VALRDPQRETRGATVFVVMERAFASNLNKKKVVTETANFDFSLARCKKEKLQEQMTVEKATIVLKVIKK